MTTRVARLKRLFSPKPKPQEQMVFNRSENRSVKSSPPPLAPMRTKVKDFEKYKRDPLMYQEERSRPASASAPLEQFKNRKPANLPTPKISRPNLSPYEPKGLPTDVNIARLQMALARISPASASRSVSRRASRSVSRRASRSVSRPANPFDSRSGSLFDSDKSPPRRATSRPASRSASRSASPNIFSADLALQAAIDRVKNTNRKNSASRTATRYASRPVNRDSLSDSDESSSFSRSPPPPRLATTPPARASTLDFRSLSLSSPTASTVPRRAPSPISKRAKRQICTDKCNKEFP
jgi:hypothetical protein